MGMNDWTAKNAAIAGTAIGVPAIAFMIYMANYDAPADTSYRDNGDLQRVDAERYCKAEVEARLKSPSSAKYSDVSAIGYKTVTVSGAVDSENSFGAMLRSRFSCTVTLEGDTWNLDTITVN